jgi:hypothetical protein
MEIFVRLPWNNIYFLKNLNLIAYICIENLVIELSHISMKGNPVRVRDCSCSCNSSLMSVKFPTPLFFGMGRFLTGGEPEDLPILFRDIRLPGIEVVV